uniref:LHFPL tetraspan subfamily member 4b n=1 Tax=Angiostrongylus cantonensis TaxID=6313 RepID=A0A0K0CXV4_ANGCA
MMTWGFNATVEQTRRSLRIQDWPWLDKVQVFFVVIAVLMSLFALLFLLVGFSATGATREEIYKREKARFGGRCACATAMAWCVLLIVCWLFIISICSVICCAYSVFDDLCYTMKSFTEEDCIDLGVFIPLVKSFSNSNLRLCGGDAQQFCALSSTASSWYIVGWVGSCLVIIGLAFFLAILASNYTHVGNVTRFVILNSFSRRTCHADSSSCSRFAEQTSNSSLSFYNCGRS